MASSFECLESSSPPLMFDANGKRIIDDGIETALILEGNRCIVIDLTFDR